MKNKKLLFIIISIVLVLALLVGGTFFLFFGNSEAEEKELPRIDAIRTTLIDEVFIDTDFSSEDVGSIPKGWIKTHPYTFLRDGDKASPIASKDKNHVEIKDFGDYKYLSISGTDGEHILTSPVLPTDNYMISAKVRFCTFGAPFGFVTNIPEDYTSAKQASLMTVSAVDADENPDDDIVTLIPTFTLSNRSEGDKKYSGKDLNLETVKVSEVDLASVVISNRETGEGSIPKDIDVVFKIYHFEGVSYFYINDKLIGDIEDKNETSASRFGFYNDLDSDEVEIKALTVASIKRGDSILNETYALNTHHAQDFSELAELPKEYRLYSGQWLDKSSMGSAEINNKQLNISSENGATALMLPALSANDYKLTAKMTIKSPGGKVGLVTNVSSPLSGSRGGSFMTVTVGEKSNVSLYNLSVNTVTELKEYDSASILGLNVNTEEELTLEACVLDSTAYFFINEVFVSYIDLPSKGSVSGFCGIYSENNASADISYVKIENIAKKGICDEIGISGTELKVEKNGNVSLNIAAKLQKNSIFCKVLAPDGLNESSPLSVGIIYIPTTSTEVKPITLSDKGVTELQVSNPKNDSGTYNITAEIKQTSDTVADAYILRGFVAIENNGEKSYFYGEPYMVSPALMASNIYIELGKTEKQALDKLYKDISGYVGKYEKSLTFTLFSDFHYKEGMYMSSIKDMQSILDRANKSGSSFLLSAGDFCNDFMGSPELMNCFLENNYDLPVYNVYGNHELELGNSMDFVTPLLTNDPDVVWGTEDGKIGDGSIAYYYFDDGPFRVICTDTNYSYNPSLGAWEHNATGSYGAPAGNTRANSLGPDQLSWLETVLTDAAKTGKSCIVIGHDSFAGGFRSTSPDASTIRELYAQVNAIRKGTVLLSINGHIHTNNFAVSEDVLYIDCNTVRNCDWRANQTDYHYTGEHTFEKVVYDSTGNPLYTEQAALNSLTMGKSTWFAADPLSAVVTVSQYGTVQVEGTKSSWIYNVVPENAPKDTTPNISSGSWELLK